MALQEKFTLLYSTTHARRTNSPPITLALMDARIFCRLFQAFAKVRLQFDNFRYSTLHATLRKVWCMAEWHKMMPVTRFVPM